LWYFIQLITDCCFTTLSHADLHVVNVLQEPDNIDKEFLRKWYASHCDPYKDAVLPEAPAELINELSRR
jgi:phosphoribosylaminoimidazole-succinocarboxamide synthase